MTVAVSVGVMAVFSADIVAGERGNTARAKEHQKFHETREISVKITRYFGENNQIFAGESPSWNFRSEAVPTFLHREMASRCSISA